MRMFHMFWGLEHEVDKCACDWYIWFEMTNEYLHHRRFMQILFTETNDWRVNRRMKPSNRLLLSTFYMILCVIVYINIKIENKNYRSKNLRWLPIGPFHQRYQLDDQWAIKYLPFSINNLVVAIETVLDLSRALSALHEMFDLGVSDKTRRFRFRFRFGQTCLLALTDDLSHFIDRKSTGFPIQRAPYPFRMRIRSAFGLFRE